MFSYKDGGGGGGGEMKESREKGDGMHRSARTQEVCESARSVQRVARAREERNGAKLKGDEEYYGEKKRRPHTRERTRRSGRGRQTDDGIARE